MMSVRTDKFVIDKTIKSVYIDEDFFGIEYDVLKLLRSRDDFDEITPEEAIRILEYDGDVNDNFKFKNFLINGFEDLFYYHYMNALLPKGWQVFYIPSLQLIVIFEQVDVGEYNTYFFRDPFDHTDKLLSTFHVDFDDRVTYEFMYDGDNLDVYVFSGTDEIGISDDVVEPTKYYNVGEKFIEYINSDKVNNVYVYPPSL